MKKLFVLAVGALAYLSFVVAILYAIGFLIPAVVPKHIDTGPVVSAGEAIAVNLLLLALFAIQHSIMARPKFKDWWTRQIPEAAERSVFVLVASGLLLLLFWQWRPMPTTVWHLEGVLATALTGLAIVGWGMVFYCSFLINHFDLFGLRQVVRHLQGKPRPDDTFRTPSVYKFVRNPLMLGFIVAFWCAPVMSQGHLLFAAVTTAYIFFGVHLEERDLLNALGEPYRRYRARTSMLIPRPPRPEPEQESAPEKD